MYLLALLPIVVGEKCTRAHNQVQKNGDYVGYLSHEPRRTLQVSRGFTKSFVEASDAL